MHSTLDKKDKNYLNSICYSEKYKERTSIKFLLLLLDKGVNRDLKEEDFIEYGLKITQKSNYRSRLDTFFKTDKKGFSVAKNTYEIRRDKNTFSNFLKEVEKFLDEHKGISRNKIKSIKIYDEYRVKDKKILLKEVYGYFKNTNIFNNASTHLIIKSIAEDINTKNFLIKMNKLIYNSDIYIIKPVARMLSVNIVFLIIELDKKSYLFYYDNQLPYNVESIELDGNKINSDLYGTIINKFDNDNNYEKFDAAQDYKNLVNNLIQWFDNIVHSEDKYEVNFKIYKNEIKKNLEKIKLYFPENKIAYEYMNLFQIFLEHIYDKPNNDEWAIEEFLKKDIHLNFIKLIEKEMHKAHSN